VVGGVPERVWWHLREEITRNHRCKDIDELLDLIFDWLSLGSRFRIETSLYDTTKVTTSIFALWANWA
jgi:hypothetical protein